MILPAAGFARDRLPAVELKSHERQDVRAMKYFPACPCSENFSGYRKKCEGRPEAAKSKSNPRDLP
jgi:hypothetical protein